MAEKRRREERSQRKRRKSTNQMGLCFVCWVIGNEIRPIRISVLYKLLVKVQQEEVVTTKVN